MKTRLLLIGHESNLNKVKTIAKEFPQLSIMTVEDQSEITPALSGKIDGVIVANPLQMPNEVSMLLDELPVFHMNYSAIALYTTLFKFFFNHNGNTSSPRMLSIDFFNKEDIRKQLAEEGISSERLRIKEYHASIDPAELINFHTGSWQKENEGAVITCHPEVYDSLKEEQVETYLITPTTPCVKSLLNSIIAKVKDYQKISQAENFRVRYEKAGSLLKEIGMSGTTIHRLGCLCDSIGSNNITAAELAKGFSITLRSARRILTTLEDHRIAKVIGEEQIKGRGRPRYVYHIDFNQFNVDKRLIPAYG
ncbi:hypothetical protein [Pseudalkalibacillus caeni]|uniref:Transcriptional regulator n=1 Tax=Exobacillus caeni TaxID=2574798 RepID=A0A5R9F0Y2_9BACL|nr:hypothetical protein [Pseudalkalibacillus caeni]TLS37217.1 hypothetical protein FCL54_11870 [Pseudalkalibacillus caeni]